MKFHGSFLLDDDVEETSPLNVDKFQSDVQMCLTVSLKTAPNHISGSTDALHNTVQNTDALSHDTTHNPEHDMTQLPTDQCVTLPGPSDLVKDRSEEVSCTHPQCTLM